MDIYSRQPINKTASMVTSQNNCEREEFFTKDQHRENLVLKVKAITKKIQSLDKKSKERILLGKELLIINKKINDIRPKKTAAGVGYFILDVLREEMTKAALDRIIEKAVIKMKEFKSTSKG